MLTAWDKNLETVLRGLFQLFLTDSESTLRFPRCWNVGVQEEEAENDDFGSNPMSYGRAFVKQLAVHDGSL